MTSSHEQKRMLFFCPSVILFKGTLPSSVGKALGAKYRVCWPQSCGRLLVLNFGWKREILKKKWKKRFFGWAKTGKHGYFCWWPTGLPDDFSGFYYFFFLLEDMSVMCLSLLTNSVGLTVKELELIPNRSFSLKSYDMKDLTFLHMLCFSVSIIQAFKPAVLYAMQYYIFAQLSIFSCRG